MKVTVIGSGSIFFTRQMVKGMVLSEHLRDAELALVDIDERKCVQMGQFCQKLNEFYGANLKISWTTDRKEALPGSNYVVLTFARFNYHYRETGTLLAQRYGINMVSSETAGPGGVFRVLRTVPRVLEVAADIEALCPKALVINYVNPTNVVSTALERHTDLNAYGFCDGIYGGMNRQVYRRLGGDGELNTALWTDLDYYSPILGGLNHFTFVWGLSRNGQDLWGRFKEGFKREAEMAAPGSYMRAEWAMCDMFDAWHSMGGHLIEYLRYFQGKGSAESTDVVARKWDLNKRIRWMKSVWFEIEACLDGRLSPGDTLKDAGGATEMVADLIESVECDQGRAFTVNLRNDGRITDLPDDVHVEVMGRFYRDRVECPPVGRLPRGLAGLMAPVVDEQELALEAALTGNVETVVKAVACDPVVMSLSDARRLVDEQLALEEAHLDARWDGYWGKA